MLPELNQDFTAFGTGETNVAIKPSAVSGVTLSTPSKARSVWRDA